MLNVKHISRSDATSHVLDGIAPSTSVKGRIGLLGQNDGFKTTLFGIVEGNCDTELRSLFTAQAHVRWPFRRDMRQIYRWELSCEHASQTRANNPFREMETYGKNWPLRPWSEFT